MLDVLLEYECTYASYGTRVQVYFFGEGYFVVVVVQCLCTCTMYVYIVCLRMFTYMCKYVNMQTLKKCLRKFDVNMNCKRKKITLRKGLVGLRSRRS